MDGRRTGESEQAHIARLNDEIERLRGQVEFERASLRSAFQEMREYDKQIEWLRKELQGQALGEKE
jgi:peptidoglycan hydrolase CwlO-like protein